ncbi:hypothetical protein COCNU_scaffold023807G000020 [Cocos nucifera]|nr:hypothetical protein [Cocos nucifera]
MASQTTTASAAVSKGKKRALAALHRSFACRSRVSSRTRTAPRKQEKEASPRGDGDPSEGKDKMMPPSAPDPSSSSLKGNLVAGRTPRRETSRENFFAIYRRMDITFQCCIDGEAHPVYPELSEMVHKSLLYGDAKAVSGGDTFNEVLSYIIQKVCKGGKYARGIKSLKFNNWVLLDNFVSKSNLRRNMRAEALQSHSKLQGSICP